MRPQLMKRPSGTHKRTESERHAALAASSGAGWSGVNPALFSVIYCPFIVRCGFRRSPPVCYVRKTCLERFPHATSFRHDLPGIFLASGKPFQPLLAACRKTSVSRHPHRCLTRPSGSRTFCFSYDRSRRIFLVSAYAYQQSVSLVEANSGYRAWRGRPVESGKIGQTPAPFRSQMNRIAETQRVRRRQRVGLVRPSLTKSDSSERQTY